MASPDVTPYVDLTLFDRDADELVDQALEDALTKLPEWTPREGNTEVVLIEELALLVAELIFAVNRLPGTVAEVLFRLYGLEYDQGQAATVDVTFTLSDLAGHTVPAGTAVRLDLGADLEDVVFETDVDLVVAAGAGQGTVAATATTVGTDPNGTPAGTTLELLDAVTFVEQVQTATQVGGGVEPEDTDAFLERARQRLRRLTDSLVLPVHFEARALEDARVARARVFDNYDPGQAGDPGDHLGHVAVAAAGTDGSLLTAGDRAELEAELEGEALANLDVHVFDPTVTAVDVTVTVRKFPGYADATVVANVTAALQAYLDPDVWPWGETVPVNELIPTIDGAEGVDLVVDLTAPAADVDLPGVAPLADAGTITVTVQAP